MTSETEESKVLPDDEDILMLHRFASEDDDRDATTPDYNNNDNTSENKIVISSESEFLTLEALEEMYVSWSASEEGRDNKWFSVKEAKELTTMATNKNIAPYKWEEYTDRQDKKAVLTIDSAKRTAWRQGQQEVQTVLENLQNLHGNHPHFERAVLHCVGPASRLKQLLCRELMLDDWEYFLLMYTFFISSVWETPVSDLHSSELFISDSLMSLECYNELWRKSEIIIKGRQLLEIGFGRMSSPVSTEP